MAQFRFVTVGLMCLGLLAFAAVFNGDYLARAQTYYPQPGQQQQQQQIPPGYYPSYPYGYPPPYAYGYPPPYYYQQQPQQVPVPQAPQQVQPPPQQRLVPNQGGSLNPYQPQDNDETFYPLYYYEE